VPKRPARTVGGVVDLTVALQAPASAAADPGYDDVPVVWWPAEADRRDRLAREGRARLLMVAPGDLPPPRCADGMEDWVREGVDAVELFVRKDLLRRRQAARVPVILDEDGVLRRGRRWVALSPRDLQVAGLLFARPGVIVARSALLRAVDPGAARDDRRLVDTLVRRFNRRVAPLGLRVHTVRSAGFLLEVAELPAG
jgi:hypothetical protein